MAEQSGTHYVRVGGTNISEYDLTIETQRLDEHDPNEHPATAAPIESGETLSAVMSGPDEDVYTIDLEEDETVNVTTDTRGTTLVNTQLLGPNTSDTIPPGLLNEHVVAWNYSNSFTHTANESGPYFIRITTDEAAIGSFDDEETYELSVTVPGTDDDESTAEDGSEIDDGTTETLGEGASSDEDDDPTGADTTESDTVDTDQSDSEESVDGTGDGAGTDTQADKDESTSQFGPGFTGGGAVVALFVTALFVLRRQ